MDGTKSQEHFGTCVCCLLFVVVVYALCVRVCMCVCVFSHPVCAFTIR